LALHAATFAGQTSPGMTLLVNSKTPWMATLHPTVEGQRDRGYCVKQCFLMLLKYNCLDLTNRVNAEILWDDNRQHVELTPVTFSRDPKAWGAKITLEDMEG
jgi:hypothetical protein